MAKIAFSKESLEQKPPLPEGMYELRLEGFEPEFSKDKNSVNLNPILKVVNHPEKNGERQLDNLNTKAGWIVQAFSHAFGFPLEIDGAGNMNLPGDFVGPDNDPEHWDYVGPLKGAVAKAFVKQTTYNGKTLSKVDQWVCALGTSCQEKHPTGLAK